jgi:hypothetical protein
MNDRIMPGMAFLGILLAAALVSCGCISAVTLSGQEAQGNSPIRVNLLDQKPDWSFSRGCTWTVTLQVVNTGELPARNVDLHVELVNADTGAVRDARQVYLGTLEPGKPETANVDLDGECLDDYTVRAAASAGA